MRTGRVCQGAKNHHPAYAETDRHHVYPVYLAALIGVPVRNTTVDLCSGCHDTAHHVIHHLINTGTVGGHHVAAGLRGVIDAAWGWYQQAVDA